MLNRIKKEKKCRKKENARWIKEWKRESKKKENAWWIKEKKKKEIT